MRVRDAPWMRTKWERSCRGWTARRRGGGAPRSGPARARGCLKNKKAKKAGCQIHECGLRVILPPWGRLTPSTSERRLCGSDPARLRAARRWPRGARRLLLRTLRPVPSGSRCPRATLPRRRGRGRTTGRSAVRLFRRPWRARVVRRPRRSYLLRLHGRALGSGVNVRRWRRRGGRRGWGGAPVSVLGEESR